MEAFFPWILAPFGLLLGSIATGPQLMPRWWARNYPLVSFGLGGGVLLAYLFIGQMGQMTTALSDYVSFICLIGSLYIVSGGVLIHYHGKATPLANTLFLLVGTVFANFFGTTGASALLIRPFLRMNRGRISGYHVVFFIFLVSNIGGLLTPVGDPPLFLGYLNGVPFFWMVQRGWRIWALAVGLLLLLFYLIDRRYAPSILKKTIDRVETKPRVSLEGSVHFLFLSMILVSVFLRTPFREIFMVAAACCSYALSRPEIYRENGFDLAPLREVAILFLGLFATMVPAVDWIHDHAVQVGVDSAGGFFWGAGLLSSILDNAPTYLNFLSAALGLHHLDLQNPVHFSQFLARHEGYLVAISVGSVFFGANTYVGNGPNLLVKGISELDGVELPTFWGYIFRYSLPILTPIYLLIWFFFFYGL